MSIFDIQKPHLIHNHRQQSLTNNRNLNQSHPINQYFSRHPSTTEPRYRKNTRIQSTQTRADVDFHRLFRNSADTRHPSRPSTRSFVSTIVHGQPRSPWSSMATMAARWTTRSTKTAVQAYVFVLRVTNPSNGVRPFVTPLTTVSRIVCVFWCVCVLFGCIVGLRVVTFVL